MGFFRKLIRPIAQIQLFEHWIEVMYDQSKNQNDGNIDSNGERWCIEHLIGDSDTVFDVGANRGEWSARCVRYHPKARVHAFEPSPTIFEKLSAQRFPSVTLCNVGLADKPGRAILRVASTDTGLSSLVDSPIINSKGGTTHEEEVVLTTIDEYCKKQDIERIEYLKIDVEGFELNVLRGAARMLSEQKISNIQFEYGPTFIGTRTFLKDIFDILERNGYKISKIYPDGLRHVDISYILENFRYCNFLAQLDPRTA